jgi:hypothetical protein
MGRRPDDEEVGLRNQLCCCLANWGNLDFCPLPEAICDGFATRRVLPYIDS